MTISGLNFVGVVLATFVSLASGGMWFGPKTFYPVWMKARGIESGQLKQDHNPGILFGGTFIGVFIQTLVVGIVITSLQHAGVEVGILGGAGIGFVLGAGIGAFGSLPHRLFGGESFKVWIIETANDVINLTIAGTIIAFFN